MLILFILNSYIKTLLLQNLIYFTSILNIRLMNVKIDTKEKFTVITPIEANITANMTGELRDLLLESLDKPVPHVILNMKNVQSISKETGGEIVASQQQFYDKNCSFVVCELNKN